MGAPVGQLTRGTTGHNRLRRCDRWLVHAPRVRTALQSATDPLVIDLGYGALPVTTLELASRLRTVRTDVRVMGLEIDPNRIVPSRDGVEFGLGGFELAGLRPVLVRAFNVLRQYDEAEVAEAWSQVQARLAPSGMLVDGTCDELGRRSTWIAIEARGPRSLTLSWRLRGLEVPSEIAERLPKALIHRNVPGEAVHRWLTELDQAWAHAAHHASFGVRQRFIATAAALRDEGWPLLDGPARWRLGEVTLAWDAVAPGAGQRA